MKYHRVGPRIWLWFWQIDDKWTLICSAQKNPFPLPPKLIKSPVLLVADSTLLSLDHCAGLPYISCWEEAAAGHYCLSCVVGFSWECRLLWTLGSLEKPLWIPEFLLIMKWEGGYYLGLSSYFIWSMWSEPSSGYFLAMELHSNKRWCCTLL